jgi:hypothetical protein
VPERWPRKRLLAGLAALVLVIAVAGIVYATSFSGNSTTSATGGGLTKPTIGAATSAGAPTPGRSHRGSPTGPGRTGGSSPSGTASAAKPSHSAGHPGKRPTSPASSRAASSPATKPTSATSSSPPPTGTPPPNAVWQCGAAADAPTQTITACIRVDDGVMQIEGKLTGVTSAGESIQLGVKSTTSTFTYSFTSGFCSATAPTCTTPAVSVATSSNGYYYATATWSADGTKQPVSGSSLLIYYAVP